MESSAGSLSYLSDLRQVQYRREIRLEDSLDTKDSVTFDSLVEIVRLRIGMRDAISNLPEIDIWRTVPAV